MIPLVRFKDKELNKFKKTNLLYADTDFEKYQDPTILGFKILFYWDQKDSGLLNRNMSLTKNIKIVNSIFGGPPILDVEKEEYTNTALAYLTRLKDDERVYYLKKFLDTLYRINTEAPWYFQTIEGLGDAWKRPLNELKFEQKELAIGCLESVDLRVTAMMDYYRKACFDWPNRREIVPINLRRFNMSIYIYEQRIFKDDALSLLTPEQIKQKMAQAATGLQDTVNDFMGTDTDAKFGDNFSDRLDVDKDDRRKEYEFDATTRLLFNFYDCEFDPDESSAILDTVNNAEPTVAVQKIKIKYWNCDESNKYVILTGDNTVNDYVVRTFDYAALDAQGDWYATDSSRGLDRFINNLKDKANDNFGQKSADYLKNQALARLVKLALGNIYGVNLLENTSNLAQGNVIESAMDIKNRAESGGRGASMKNGQKSENMGNDIKINPPSVSLANSEVDLKGAIPGDNKSNGNTQKSIGGGNVFTNSIFPSLANNQTNKGSGKAFDHSPSNANEQQNTIKDNPFKS